MVVRVIRGKSLDFLDGCADPELNAAIQLDHTAQYGWDILARIPREVGGQINI